MTLQVHIWKDGSVSVTRNMGPYNRYEVIDTGHAKVVEIDEPKERGDEDG